MTTAETILPPPDLEKGPATAKWVLGVIERFPDSHWQSSWEENYGTNGFDSSCGTTRCVGGWALFAHGIERFPSLRTDPPNGSNTAIAGPLLGLSFADADRLFYYTSDEEAREALAYVVAGEPIDWRAVLGDEFDDLPDYEEGEALLNGYPAGGVF